MKEVAKIDIFRFSELDGFEVKEAIFLNKKFPKHFHTEWSLCRIDTGCENVQIENKELLLFSNATILIPPFSVHSNWGNKDSSWKYQSIYLNEDLVKYVTNKRGLDYNKLILQPYYLAYDLPRINTNSLNFISQIEEILCTIFKREVSKHHKLEKSEMLSYLKMNFKDKITLSDLEKKFKINKYKILRDFKNEIGITPLEYVIALRMENAKKMFFENEKVVNVALDNGFYDQSHFVHTFKKYFGVTPFNYKSSCNILQD